MSRRPSISDDLKLSLHRVTSFRDLRKAWKRANPDPFEVDGAERAFRLNKNFQIENARGAQGAIELALIWWHAQMLDQPLFQRLRERAGFNQPAGIFDFREELLIDMAPRIAALRDELGSEFMIWATLLLASRPQKGGTASLLADINKCREQSTALGILDCLASENMRRETEGQYG